MKAKSESSSGKSSSGTSSPVQLSVAKAATNSSSKSVNSSSSPIIITSGNKLFVKVTILKLVLIFFGIFYLIDFIALNLRRVTDN